MICCQEHEYLAKMRKRHEEIQWEHLYDFDGAEIIRMMQAEHVAIEREFESRIGHTIKERTDDDDSGEPTRG